ncbi:hypothetical protein BGW41_006166 [Actinomortierella wolfii]|nr:hypothetical protein BGW41_006166 [Actinomortierella wolfii]
MGQLEAACFAEGRDNTLYALSFGYDHSRSPGSSGSENAIVVLLKSNSAPSPSNLSWQVVSTISKKELYSLGMDGLGENSNCIVDPDGGFLAWNYYTYRPNEQKSRPGGFRYDPALSTSSATTTGKGGWVNVDTALSYSWTSTSSAGDLLYLKDASTGKYQFYHVYIPGNFGDFSTAALNTATSPNMMESTPIKWNFKSTITGYPDGLMITESKLFIWGVAAASGGLFAVGDMPQTGPLPSSAPSTNLVNYTRPSPNCYGPLAVDDDVYMYCPYTLQHGKELKLHVMDGSKILEPISMPKAPVDSYQPSVSGIFGDGTTSYMLVQTGRLAKYSTKPYQLSALVLSGPSAGILMDVPNKITVSDSIGYLPKAEEKSDGGGGGGLSIALRWIIGLLVPSITILCVIRIVRRRRRPEVVYVSEPPSQVVTTTTTTTVFR